MYSPRLNHKSNRKSSILSIDQVSVEHLLERHSKFNEPIEAKIPDSAGASGLNFVASCLQMDANQRPTTDDLLLHNYIYSSRIKQFATRGGIATSRLDTSRGSTRMQVSSKRQALTNLVINNSPKISPMSSNLKSVARQQQQPSFFNQSENVRNDSNKASCNTRIPVTAQQDETMSSNSNKKLATNHYKSSKIREREKDSQNVRIIGLGSTRGSRIPKPISLPFI